MLVVLLIVLLVILLIILLIILLVVLLVVLLVLLLIAIIVFHICLTYFFRACGTLPLVCPRESKICLLQKRKTNLIFQHGCAIINAIK